MLKKRLFVLTLLVATVFAGLALSAWPQPIPGPSPVPGPFPCPNQNIYCLDVWDPVTCDNGVTYSNQCYADRACATGCVEGYPSQ